MLDRNALRILNGDDDIQSSGTADRTVHPRIVNKVLYWIGALVIFFTILSWILQNAFSLNDKPNSTNSLSSDTDNDPYLTAHKKNNENNNDTLKTTDPKNIISKQKKTNALLNASGYVIVRRMATVSSNVTGRIEEIFVGEGVSVEKGQVLASLDNTIAKTKVSLYQNRLHLARAALLEIEIRIAESTRNLERLKALEKDGFASEKSLSDNKSEVNILKAQLQTAKNQIRVAESELLVAEQELSELVIRAPFSGVIISKNAQAGEIISPVSTGDGFTRTGISTIADMKSLEIEVDVSESYVDKIETGQPTVSVLEAYPNWEISGYVINVVPAVNRQKATVKVRVGFNEIDPRILPNMGVQVAFYQKDSEQHSGYRTSMK